MRKVGLLLHAGLSILVASAGALSILAAPLFASPPGALAGADIHLGGNYSYFGESVNYKGEFGSNITVDKIYGIRKIENLTFVSDDVAVGKINIIDWNASTSEIEPISFRNFANSNDNITFSIENITYTGFYGAPWNITLIRDNGDGFYNETLDSTVITPGDNITLPYGGAFGFYIAIEPSVDAQDLASLNFNVVVRASNMSALYVGDNGCTYGGYGELRWNVTVTAHKPFIVETYPEEGQEWVPVDVIMMVRFSLEMDPSTFVVSDPPNPSTDTVLLYDTARDEYFAIDINTPDNKTFYFAPKERLHGLTTYRLTLKGNITSATGSVMNSDFSLTFRTLLRKDEGGVVKSGDIEVVVPPDVLFADAVVQINSTGKVPDSFKPLKLEKVVSHVKVLFYDVSNNLQGDSDKDGLPDEAFSGTYTVVIDGDNVDSGSNMRYRAYVLTDKGWEKQKGEVSGSQLKAYLTYGSNVVLVEVKMDQNYLFNPYPNPFNPSRGSLTIQLKVKDFSPDAKIYIYSIDGSLVRVLNVEDPSELNIEEGLAYWDGKDESGRDVATGVYVLVLVNGSEKLYKKVVVVR